MKGLAQFTNRSFPTCTLPRFASASRSPEITQGEPRSTTLKDLTDMIDDLNEMRLREDEGESRLTIALVAGVGVSGRLLADWT